MPRLTMMQFDVFPNPVTGARGSYPFVVVLQADVAEDGLERAVSSLAERRHDILAAIDYLFFGV